ncbi:TonB-dependent receptor [Aquimarina sediminis]|uniref:TonB-dependent receptor n=1 Tax=Aquimarina sediminis TaxID=2070536 RepID=UPI000CA053CE|nr:TonB-dependent receptor [Aquimarina sediminis]
MQYILFFITVFFTFPETILSQEGVISGVVINEKGEQLSGAHIFLSSANKSLTSDDSGFFKIRNLNLGEHQIIVSHLGYQTQQKTIILSKIEPETKITIHLIEESDQLNEITVLGASKATKIKNGTTTVSIVEASKVNSRSVTTSDLLSTVSGVQIRQSGGVGNSTEISIQGLSGRQVKFFVDGIPMDFLYPVEELGIGSSLAMLPVNLIKRMEVYKGAVPVAMGVDALGGAINIVTRKEKHDFLEATVAHSSFNTWKATVNTRKVLPSGVTAGLAGYYTYSDNSYTLEDVNIVNDQGNPESISAKKFHDAFRSYMIKGDIGVINKSWADQITLNFSYADLYDEIQHNFEMRQPYGEALNRVSTFNNSLQYQKSDLIKNLDANLYFGYNSIITRFDDNTLNIYNWRGEIIGQRTSGGEITASQNKLKLNGENVSGRIFLKYDFSATSRLIFNGVASFFRRSGEDPVAAAFYGNDYYQNPVHIHKITNGIGLEKYFLDKKITTSSALKLYQYKAKGFEITNNEINEIEQQKTAFGVSQSFSWKFVPEFLGKLSYEYATRLPDRIETLGDFSLAVAANPNLKPERSHNINLGSSVKKQTWNAEINGFFREVENIIILQAVPPPVLSTYENLLKTRILGLEGEIGVMPLPWLSITLNGTFQDLRNRSKKENSGVSNDRYFGARLPNKPYLFGNSEVQITKNNLFKNKDKMQFWWSTRYVEEFFRYWEIDGRKEDKLVIPTQWLHNLGISYTGKQKRYTLTLETQNIFNQQAFDNFGVQKPGRSWHLKLKTSLFKS